MNLPKPIRKLIESFEKLPGMGPKTAARLTFYLLHVPQVQLEDFADALKNLKLKTVLCSICFNVSETDPCPICLDRNRDKSTICVVEQPLDILALEKAGNYKGAYHVLHGAISPLNNIGPEELYIKQLLERVKTSFAKASEVKEIILATNPTMEGEATAMYIKKELEKLEIGNKRSLLLRNWKLEITRLGLGLPTGADIEYADEVTLSRAIEGRRKYQ
ncbi:recombination protein RecR [Candidatus Shapirobacteria bacterium CG_4_9_14_0_2_um_filter_39_11]|uniref:Recombination protein RecR n=1 Tax=Candidatus Shapirobacteria bacterium CG_4_9_14_0_2_um_filter_39_11 TaxID=1974478 RepID=A0A2M8ETA3_9BACT|nr:MAG: recombination protein RecR [Candidatus Shapirobacteria bacterium CG_4_9_14_0_2_um_filter_39_11]